MQPYSAAIVWNYQPLLLPKLHALLSFARTLYYSTPMPAVNPSTARGHKRKRSPEVEDDTTPPYDPPWKRGGFRSAEEANIAFWDNLSKVALFPHSLKEFDRRNPPLVRPAAFVGSLDSTSLEGCSAQLKLFARRGGPDLRDLRGVCMIQGDFLDHC